ncbi:hypothetical protein [Halorussus litoreus]|uniref:hypothetical protein n=1 Tax=Halorussus litoreus TaxID=1710536 RepID=UPI000E248164|nr:hypothetical protein [Halorussus litoreus]
MSDLLRKAGRYLDDHWVLKWFVVPVLFMASILFVVGVLVSRASSFEILQLAGLFVAFSLAVVVLGLVLDKAFHRITGWNLFETSNEHDRG